MEPVIGGNAPVHSVSTTRMGQTSRGSRRVWLEGRRLEQAGFVPAARYTLSVDAAANALTLAIDPAGDRMVSRRARGGGFQPIVDIASSRALSTLDGFETLRVRFEDGRIVITPTASEARRGERTRRLRERLAAGTPLVAGSVSTGLGVLSYALHDGLREAGLDVHLAFSIEIDENYQERCAAANPVWRDETVAIAAPMQEIAFDASALAALPHVDVLEAGIPCTAHSSAGRAKKRLAIPEDDPNAGHLVAGFLAIVAATNPGVVIVENVPQYLESASFSILSNQLVEWGYDVRSTILKGADFGCLENRDRMALVATTIGVDVDVQTLAPAIPPSQSLSDVLEDVPNDSPTWSTMDYLREKEIRDIAAGKFFRMQIFDGSSGAVSTIGRGYAKVRSTEPKIRNADDPTLLRQLTPVEHARIKGVPEAMIAGIPPTIAHEMLGQSVLVEPFRALGARIGGALDAWIHDRPAPHGEPRAPKTSPIDELPLFA
jgi:DNA (cytosine-5)-methyltransferase 1